MRPKDADGIADPVDPDRSSLIWVCAVCFGLSVPIVRISMVLDCDKVTQAPSLLPGIKIKTRG